jgi:hypothetical protein
MLQEENKVSSKSRAFPSTTVSPKSSLAQRAGTVNGVSSYGVMFDSGCNRSIVSKRLVTGLRRFPCTSHKVQYGNGTEVIRERVLVPVVTDVRNWIPRFTQVGRRVDLLPVIRGVLGALTWKH